MPIGGSLFEGMTRSNVHGTVPALACVVGDYGVRSPGCKSKPLLFHPGVAGEGKAGRVNASKSSDAPLSAAPPMGRSSGAQGWPL